MKYNKLVRDKIPEVITNKGGTPIFHHALSNEYVDKLKEKLQEEVSEFLKDGAEEELADILEVIDALCVYNKIDRKKLEALKKNKKDEKGGFEKRIILDETK